jgi:pimeloyl-ACP methyl ester carboxylesterase
MSPRGGARNDGGSRWAVPFLAGAMTSVAGMVLLRAVSPRRRLVDPRLIRRAWHGDENVPPAVIVPGIMGSGLLREDQTRVWLNLRNAVGQYNLSLPFVLPLTESRDELRAGSLLGTEHRLPRLFGFTEYYDLLELLEAAGFVPAKKTGGRGLVHHVFAYDWRRDLVESVRRLDETLEALADARGEPDTRFNIVGHSMGGLIARYYLRYGTAEPQAGMPVTWAGARRINSMVLVAVPNAGSIHSLEAMLYGNRVGLSYTTLAASVIARMPSVYQLIPPKGSPALLDAAGAEVDADLHDIATWERFGWGPFGSTSMRRLSGLEDNRDQIGYDEFLAAVLQRAGAFHRALVQTPLMPCPIKVTVLGGDCMPTMARCIVPDKRGSFPRFEPLNRHEADAMFDAGDGRVTRSSVLGTHLPGADESESGSGYPEVARTFIGSADHHGIYKEPTFQSVLLRQLLRPASIPTARTLAEAATGS